MAKSKDPVWQRIFGNAGLMQELPAETIDKIRQRHHRGSSSIPSGAPADDAPELTPEKTRSAPSRVQECRPAVLGSSEKENVNGILRQAAPAAPAAAPRGEKRPPKSNVDNESGPAEEEDEDEDDGLDPGKD